MKSQFKYKQHRLKYDHNYNLKIFLQSTAKKRFYKNQIIIVNIIVLCYIVYRVCKMIFTKL